MVVEEAVEMLADGVEDDALVTQLTIFHIAQDVQLHIEKLLEFKSQLCMSQGIGRGGIMDVTHGIVVGHQMMLLHDVRRQSLSQRLLEQLEHVGRQFGDGRGVEPTPLHLLRGVVGRTEDRPSPHPPYREGVVALFISILISREIIPSLQGG